MSSPISGAAIVSKSVAALHPNPRNARRHSKRQLKLIAKSIETFGFVNPILIDETDTVLAGHGRLEAAKTLGHDTVPTLLIEGLNEVQKRAYVLADNKLADLAGWDRSMLATELGELAVLLPTLALDWNVDITGFATGEIDGIIADHAEVRSEAEDAIPADKVAQVSQHGDLWQLGSHRVLCGDALCRDDLESLLGPERADVLFTDPPYNVPIQGHVSRRKGSREFAMASGELSPEAFKAFLRTSLENGVAFSNPGAVHFVCMDWRHITPLITLGEDLYDALLNLCVWNKSNAGQGSFYRSQHELVAVFRVAGASHQNNIALGAFGRNRSNVWNYPGVSGFGRHRADALAMHPTVKPVALVADALRDCSSKGALVLDLFLGSGTTVIAAEKVGRRCTGLEYDPGYVDVIVRRWQQYSGSDAVLIADGRTFDELAVTRGSAILDAGSSHPG